jgi:uncharacterized lipoprotein YajG
MKYLIIALGLFLLAGCEAPPPSDPALDRAYDYVSLDGECEG